MTLGSKKKIIKKYMNVIISFKTTILTLLQHLKPIKTDRKSIFYLDSLNITSVSLLECPVVPQQGTLYLVHCTLHLAPCTFYLVPYTLHLIPFTLDPSPSTFQLSPCTLYLAPFTFYLIPFLNTLEWIRNTLRPSALSGQTR